MDHRSEYDIPPPNYQLDDVNQLVDIWYIIGHHFIFMVGAGVGPIYEFLNSSNSEKAIVLNKIHSQLIIYNNEHRKNLLFKQFYSVMISS